MRTILLAFVATSIVLPLMHGRPIAAQVGSVLDDPDVYAVYASVLPARFGSDDRNRTG
jgi:hypothetical protein